MVADVQIESHTPSFAHGGRSASAVNPSLAPGGAPGKDKLAFSPPDQCCWDCTLKSVITAGYRSIKSSLITSITTRFQK